MMVIDREEVEEAVTVASGLLINIGTLTTDLYGAMVRAVTTAKSKGVPWVLDPVGVGLSRFRKESISTLLSCGAPPAVIRGNGSEVAVLAGILQTTSSGVDASAQDELYSVRSAIFVARKWGTICAVSGKEDVICDGNIMFRCCNGVPLLSCITATGCSLNALITAMISVCHSKDDYCLATAAAFLVLTVCSEIAEKILVKSGKPKASPGSLRVHLLDSISVLGREDFLSMANCFQKSCFLEN